MKCEYCGAELTPGARFCENCGRRVQVFHEIGVSSQLQFYTPITNQGDFFDNTNNLYLFNMEKGTISTEKNKEIGRIEFHQSLFKIKCKVYDKDDDLVLYLKQILIDIPGIRTFRLMDNNGKEIAKIRKASTSNLLTKFYIESPYKEKWFAINKSRLTNYEVKSFITNEIVAEFGHMRSFKELILDFDIKNPSNIYILKILDEKIDRSLLIGAFIVNYIIKIL